MVVGCVLGRMRSLNHLQVQTLVLTGLSWGELWNMGGVDVVMKRRRGQDGYELTVIKFWVIARDVKARYLVM